MDNNLSTQEWVKRAYKKLKGNVYFDKTQLPLIDQIVSFEHDNLEKKLGQVAQALEQIDVWEDYIEDITSKIDALVYPKKLRSWPENQVIFNVDNEPIEMEKAQYFIDLPVGGHLLGTLWVLTVGAQLDNRNDPDNLLMYEHSYGNRLRKSLYNADSEDITYSPYLFEPYFSQYESWRDTALSYAKDRLNNKQDALILTLDLRSFFYGVHIPKENFDDIFETASVKIELPTWGKRVHDFVYRVLEVYSQKVRNTNVDSELPLSKRVFLPIGFLPSNILSNWILTPFDEAISRRINPVYYGRYVDDVIIVDKVEKNSPLRKRAQGKSTDSSKLTAQDVIAYYFCSCSATEEMPDVCKQIQLFLPLELDKMTPSQKKVFQRNQEKCKLESCKHESCDKYACVGYRINPAVLLQGSTSTEKPEIQIQNDKVKVFYFREGATRALLDCFHTQIAQNASEFRFLPDMDYILGKNDYSEIFKLQNDETLNKLRGVTGVSLDKFSLSKFLGKYRKAGGMIRDKKESAFDRDLLAILNKRTLIENYTLWERILEIMIVNDRLENYEKLIKKIIDAINDYEVPPELVNSYKNQSRHALILNLHVAVCRTAALYWGPKIDHVLENIQVTANKVFENEALLFQTDLLTEKRIQYCRSRMVNKYILPLPIGWLKDNVFTQKDKNINLCHLESFLANVDWTWTLDNYVYFPYMVTPQEIAYALACKNIATGEEIDSPDIQWKNIRELYLLYNFCISDNTSKTSECKDVDVQVIHNRAKSCYAISVDTPAAKKIKVAVGNARLYENDFKLALTGTPNRSYERYQQVYKLLKEALEAYVDLLVLPENFLPWEWVPDISRLCANNQMALITGVEHILSSKVEEKQQQVYNLTAVILPYRKDVHKFAHIVYHQKVHFSPEEKRKIKGYRLKPLPGNEYQLFQWKDLWFSVYCCFELASIAERALFQSFADLTVAVEWNRDVPYFSSIMESLCRDLHCYCIQANSSDFGDSRVMSPTKTDLRDVIKTKGGLNHTILADEIDIDALREYQRKEYELQRDDHRFKPTPPNFEPSIPEHKQNGTLWNHLRKTLLYQELKKYRDDTSKMENVKAHFIFTNDELEDIIARMPQTLDELKKIAGFGEVKCQKYGNAIVQIVRKYI